MNFKLITDYISGSLQHTPNTPKIGVVLSENAALIVFVSLVFIALIVGKYAIATKILGKKSALKSLIPFYGLMILFRAVDLNPWLGITCYIPVVGIIPYAIFGFFVAKAFGQPINFQILSIFFPYVTFNMFGFDKKYEYQYVKGKNVAFKNEFRTVMPEDLTTPASAVNGAALNTLGAKESMVSRAASAAAEQTRIIREEQERKAKEEEEAKKKAEEEAKRKAEKQKPEDFKYDIFNSDDQDLGPASASLNIEFRIVNGRFKSAPDEPTPVPASAPAPGPVQMPEPVQPEPAQPVEQPAPVEQPMPEPMPVPEPVQQPVPEQPETPGIQMSSIPPEKA